MADIADDASNIEQERINIALQAHKSKQNLISRVFCIDCEIVIPAARLAIVRGCQRCVDCQSIAEMKGGARK